MRTAISFESNLIGLACGSPGCMASMTLPTIERAIARLDEFRSRLGIDRLCLLDDGGEGLAISEWAASVGVPVDVVDIDTVARNFCGTDDATAGTIVAEAEARGFDVMNAEALAIAAFDFALGGPDATRARQFQ